MRSVILLSALLVCAAASAAEVYKWKDKDGKVHYGDKPKTEAAESLSVESGSGEGESSEAEAKRLAREAECKTKTAALANYRRAPKLSEIDNLGKEREYTPAEREQFIAMQQKKADEACAPPPAESAGTFPQPAPETPAEPAQ